MVSPEIITLTEKNKMPKLLSNEETIDIKPENGTNFTLQELYRLIDCDTVQICPAKEENEILIFDEEFLMKNEPELNGPATSAMHKSMMPYEANIICGKAILCNEKFLS